MFAAVSGIPSETNCHINTKNKQKEVWKQPDVE